MYAFLTLSLSILNSHVFLFVLVTLLTGPQQDRKRAGISPHRFHALAKSAESKRKERKVQWTTSLKQDKLNTLKDAKLIL